LKLRVRENVKKKLIPEGCDIFSYILSNADYKSGFEGILELMKIYTALPLSNAEVERGFSAMNRVKNDLRNRLSVGKLEDLMMITLNGPEVKDWNPLEAFNFWSNNFHPNNLPKGQ